MSELITEQYSVDTFKRTAPGYGQILLLFQESEDVQLEDGSRWEGEGNIQTMKGIAFKAGKQYPLEAMTIRCQDMNGNANGINLRVCNQITIILGGTEIHCVIGNRFVQTSYAFLETYENASLSSPKMVEFDRDVEATFYRVKVGNEVYKFVDYECNLGDSEEGNIILLYPTFGLAYENSDFNPTFNNVTNNSKNSYTRNLETHRISSTATHYSRSVDRPTTLAEIADSFYTSIQNISGRFLGSKNNLITTYIGDKGKYSKVNLTASMLDYRNEVGEIVHNDQIRRRDLPYFHLQGFTGSIYPVGTEDAALKSMNVSEMVLEILHYTSTASYTGSAENYSDQMFVNRSRVAVPHVTHTELYVGSVPPSGGYTGSRSDVWIVENNLPQIGSILYRINGSIERLPNVKVYSPDLGAALKTDDYGIVSDILAVQDLQVS